MALKPTIYKTQISLADSDRHHYEELSLTLARHPSETAERLSARLLSYCLQYHPKLEFTRGLSATDEPELWQHDDSGLCEHWIEVGQPDPARLRKACGLAPLVSVYTYGSSTHTWWQGVEETLQQQAGLQVWQFPSQQIEDVAGLIDRNCKLNVSIAGGTVYIDNGAANSAISPQLLLENLS